MNYVRKENSKNYCVDFSSAIWCESISLAGNDADWMMNKERAVKGSFLYFDFI